MGGNQLVPVHSIDPVRRKAEAYAVPDRAGLIEWYKTVRSKRWRIRLAGFNRAIDRNFIDCTAMTYGGTVRRNTVLDPTIWHGYVSRCRYW
jgi:hypothetical protein